MTEQTSTVVCRKCGVIHETENLIIKMISLPGGGSHKKATCPMCRSFIKFIPHSIPALYFGKYKQTVPNELYCSKSGGKPLNIANLSSFSGVMRHFNL